MFVAHPTSPTFRYQNCSSFPPAFSSFLSRETCRKSAVPAKTAVSRFSLCSGEYLLLQLVKATRRQGRRRRRLRRLLPFLFLLPSPALLSTPLEAPRPCTMHTPQPLSSISPQLHDLPDSPEPESSPHHPELYNTSSDRDDDQGELVNFINLRGTLSSPLVALQRRKG